MLTPPPTQLSLLNKTLLDQLNLRHSSTKLPNQCKFAVYRQHVHIVMHVKNYIRLAYLVVCLGVVSNTTVGL